MTPLNVPCPTKYMLTGNPTSPNKVAEEVILLVLSFLSGKDKIGGQLRKNYSATIMNPGFHVQHIYLVVQHQNEVQS